MNDRFDFEQQIVKCWGVVDDLKELSEHIIEYNIVGTDTIHNHIFGLANVYDVKFHKLWDGFEDVVMGQVKHIRMLEEECAALREQLSRGVDEDGFGK